MTNKTGNVGAVPDVQLTVGNRPVSTGQLITITRLKYEKSYLEIQNAIAI
jgi:hypothetical protein